MKLNLAVIHLDMVVDTLELEPGEYTLGRSSENNIVVQHFSLHLKHGRVFCEEEQWFYEDLTSKKTTVINNAESISLSDHISLATDKHVEHSKAKLANLSMAKQAHSSKLRKRVALVATFAILLLAGSFFGYKKFRGESQSVTESTLLNRVRTKIVEFEINRDGAALDQLKKYAGLSDSDFKESSGFCTGFLVGPNIVLTAGHCLLGRMVIDINNDFYIKTHDGKRHQVEQVLGFDVKRDFLFLRTTGMEGYGHLNFADSYKVEQKVYTVGNVHGEGIAIRDGIISSESQDLDDPSVKFIRYSAGTSPGNSGGPLVDKNGDVVALVFASTNTENFNLGTPSTDLSKAYDQFALAESAPQTIPLQMKRVLNFKAPLMLQALSLPYLPQFDQHPEISRAFNEISIDVEVPIEFSAVDEAILAPLNQKVKQTFIEVQDLLKKRQEVVLDWKSFVTDATPAILPSQFDISQSSFVKINNRYYPRIAGLIDSPSKADFSKYIQQLKKEEKFDFQSYGYNIQVADEKIDLLNSDVFYKPKNPGGDKQRLLELAYDSPYSQLLVYGTEDIRTPGFFGLKIFLKNFLSRSGVLANSMSRFVRPQSTKDFTLTKIDFDQQDIKVATVKDGFNREWKRSRIKLFESLHLFTYCSQLPEGTFCIGRAFNVYNDFMLKTIEGNFREFILSHLLINPYFWETKALVSYIKAGNANHKPSMAGVDLQLSGDKILGALDRFPFKFEIQDSSKVESLRLQTGLYGNSKEANWAGYGVEWIQREKDKDLVCGLGLEAFESQSSFVLNFLRDRRKQEKLKKIKGEPAKPLPGIWYRPFRGLKTPFQIYGYCAPLEEDPRVGGQFFVDFKNARPFKYKYTIVN